MTIHELGAVAAAEGRWPAPGPPDGLAAALSGAGLTSIGGQPEGVAPPPARLAGARETHARPPERHSRPG